MFTSLHRLPRGYATTFSRIGIKNKKYQFVLRMHSNANGKRLYM